MANKAEDKLAIAKISYKKIDGRIIIEGFENVVNQSHLTDETNKIYSSKTPYFYINNVFDSIFLFCKTTHYIIRVGDVFSSKEFGVMVSNLKEAGERLTRIRKELKNKVVKTIEI